MRFVAALGELGHAAVGRKVERLKGLHSLGKRQIRWRIKGHKLKATETIGDSLLDRVEVPATGEQLTVDLDVWHADLPVSRHRKHLATAGDEFGTSPDYSPTVELLGNEPSARVGTQPVGQQRHFHAQKFADFFQIGKSKRKKMVKISLTNEAEFRRMVEQYAAKTGKGLERGVKEIAMSSARALAQKVQPFGLGKDKGAKFIANIGRQIDQAYIGVNLGAYPATNSMEEAHMSQRKNGKIRPRKFRKERGQPWLKLITQAQKEEYKRKIQKKAGRAKGAWVQAGNSLNAGKMSGVPDWIKRHATSGYGGSSVTGFGLDTVVELYNKTPYLRSIQRDRDVQAALITGRKNGFKRLQTILEKLNKTV